MSNVNNPGSALAYEFSFINDRTGIRYINGTVYQNNQGYKQMFVVVTLDCPMNADLLIKCDANANPSQIIAEPRNTNLSGVTVIASFFVPAHYYYKIVTNNGAPNLLYWIEYV